LDVAASSSEEEEGEMDLEEDLEEVEMERVVREAVGVWGGIDVLVNCAGMYASKVLYVGEVWCVV
jgi:NAD(P)-dependent dehydrogenase (short-subunit alcohol dehydrogenase family)